MHKNRPTSLFWLFLLSLQFATGCSSSIKKIPTKGELHVYSIETTVDDERAKYYLENYLPGKGGDPNLQVRIESLHKGLDSKMPDRDDLKQISKDFSVDFAALVFANHLLKQPGNLDLQKRFLKNLEQVRAKSANYPKRTIKILMVPGYDYVSNGAKTGADFAKPIKLLREAGADVHLVEIDPIGSVEENAEFLAKTMERYKEQDVVLVGASSAGPAIHLAIGKTIKPDDLKRVKAWLNLGGVLQGVPVLEKVQSGVKGMIFSLVIWFKDWKRHSFDSMRIGPSRVRYAGLSVPSHIKIYNYVGMSLSGDISDFARDKYEMMREDGPNDGLTFLPDIIPPRSLSILAPKSDHFFAEDPEIDNKTLALLLTIFSDI